MATITFGSNQTVNGTTGNDSMIGNQTGGNFNDIVYGHQGDDTITSANGLFNSNLYGGQGNDSIVLNGGTTPGGNAIYGNLGNDIFSAPNGATADSFFGGQGNDTALVTEGNSAVIYGNLGDDLLQVLISDSATLFGGQGNDSLQSSGGNLNVIYGNLGNDTLVGIDLVSNTHEYGGQGDDTLVFSSRFGGQTLNDVETGNLGNDVFEADNGNAGSPINANDIVTVTDFLQGTDKLAMTTMANVPLVKIQGTDDNAAQALAAANSAFNNPTTDPGHQREYIFVYGGTGAGYLFYNSDVGGSAAQAGMAIEGATGENSVNVTDIITSKFG